MSAEFECKALKILHVTDIHCAYGNIEQLKRWLKDGRHSIDIVLVSGDIANFPAEAYYTGTEEMQREHEEHLKKITEGFLSVATAVYYIPGNHDTLSNFSTKSNAIEESKFPMNVHMKSVRVAPNLTLLGLGGSVPSFTPEGQQVWEGYPYQSDDKFGEDVRQLLDPVVNSEATPPKETYLLMTHNGPRNSSTTEVRCPSNQTILSGSEVLHSYIMKTKLQNHSVLHIHGHTHDCTGMSTIGQLSIVNPGAMVDGHFGIYCLEAVCGAHPSWKIRSISLHRLDGSK